MVRSIRTWSILAISLLLLISSMNVLADSDDDFQVLVGSDRPPNAPLNPECENQTNPGDLATLTPYFDWTFSDPDILDAQGGFHIQFGDDSNWGDGAEMWDSNQTANTDNHVAYGGLVLTDDVWYYWRVKTRDDGYSLWGTWTGTQQFKTETPNIIIRDLTILDDELTELEASVIVENAGITDQIVNLQWVLKKTLNDKVLDFGHNILFITAGSARYYEVQPETEYLGSVYINFTGSGAYNQTTFDTTRGGGADGGAQGGGGGEPPPLATELGDGEIPVAVDTDDDGLSDEFEEQVTQTDPLVQDTDHDGFTDYEEYMASSDPLDSGSTPVSTDFVIWGVASCIIIFVACFFLIFLFRRRRSNNRTTA